MLQLPSEEEVPLVVKVVFRSYACARTFESDRAFASRLVAASRCSAFWMGCAAATSSSGSLGTGGCASANTGASAMETATAHCHRWNSMRNSLGKLYNELAAVEVQQRLRNLVCGVLFRDTCGSS